MNLTECTDMAERSFTRQTRRIWPSFLCASCHTLFDEVFDKNSSTADCFDERFVLTFFFLLVLYCTTV